MLEATRSSESRMMDVRVRQVSRAYTWQQANPEGQDAVVKGFGLETLVSYLYMSVGLLCAS